MIMGMSGMIFRDQVLAQSLIASLDSMRVITLHGVHPVSVKLNTTPLRDVSHVATKNKMKDLKRGSVVRFKKTGYVVIYLGKSEGMYCFYSGEYGKCDFAADRFKWSKLEIISEAR